MPPKTTSKPKKTSVAKSKKVVKSPPKETQVVDTPVVETPVVETPVVDAPVSATPVVDEVSTTPYVDEFSSLVSELDSALTLIKSLKSRVMKLEKQVHRDTKVMAKKLRGRKTRVRDPNAPKSGFAKEGPVSDAMSKFLGLTKGVQFPTDFNKAYSHLLHGCLQNPDDKRKINPDASLKIIESYMMN